MGLIARFCIVLVFSYTMAEEPVIDNVPTSRELKTFDIVEATVEIAVWCDVDCGKMFHQNQDDFLEYLRALFQDVQLRFKTLTRSKISFQVTSINILKEGTDQPFLEENRRSDGLIGFNNTYESFVKWVYNERENIPKFDVAMALVSAPIYDPPTLGIAKTQCACYVNDEERSVPSSFMISFTERNADVGMTVAHEIAHLLGSRHDNTIHDLCISLNNNHPDCVLPRGSIMDTRVSGADQFNFSAYSDIYIYQFLLSPNYNCLKETNSLEVPLIDTRNISNVRVPSALEQCNLFHSKATVVAMANQSNHSSICHKVNCAPAEIGKPIYRFSPLDGTPCEQFGVCSRGKCVNMQETVVPVPNIVQISASASGKFENRFDILGLLAVIISLQYYNSIPTGQFTNFML